MSARMRCVRLVLGGLVVLYAGGFMLWYSATPLGLYPVLDGREILQLARHIADATLAREPFYRAPLYPALLAVLLKSGVQPADLPMAARVFNLALHLGSCVLVWSIAWRVWQRELAAGLALALFALNPVVLHFMGDPLDITLAMTLMLGAVRATLGGLPVAGSPRLRWLALAAILFALAVLARPQMLTVLIAFWLLVAWHTLGPVRSVLAALLPALLVLALMGMVNERISGDFRILPWQGAFNLWAANHPGANGRYFEQTRRVVSYDEDSNAARLEAARLYHEDRPDGATDPASMTRYWRARIVGEIADDLPGWSALLARKGFYLLNNFEQYNNKTYHLHKARSPWLAPNPLGWSVLLSGAVLGFCCLRARAASRLFALMILSYAAGLLMTYVSARFRLPLVPLAAILAGGVTQLAHIPRPGRALSLAAVVAAVSLLPLAPGDADKTLVQDYLLLARAALEVGDTEDALRHAEAALARAPAHGAAEEIVCVAHFNAWLGGSQATRALAPVVGACAVGAADSPVARRILGIAYWRLGRDDEALDLLRALARERGPEHDLALAALIMIGDVKVAPLTTDGAEGLSDPLLLALAQRGDAVAFHALAQRIGVAERTRQLAAMATTFSR